MLAAHGLPLTRKMAVDSSFVDLIHPWPRLRHYGVMVAPAHLGGFVLVTVRVQPGTQAELSADLKTKLRHMSDA